VWHRGFIRSVSRSGESVIRLYRGGASYTTTLRPELVVGTQVNIIVDLSTMTVTSVKTDSELQAIRESEARNDGGGFPSVSRLSHIPF
jgi:hypothetical protein